MEDGTHNPYTTEIKTNACNAVKMNQKVVYFDSFLDGSEMLCLRSDETSSECGHMAQ